MILLALSLLVAVETHVLPRPEPDVDVTVVAPPTAPQGVLEPPPIPPRTALAAATLPPDPPDDGSAYAETTRMRRIAQRMLGTIVVGSTVAVLVHTCAG